MTGKIDSCELVRKAQRGCRESMGKLAQLSQPKLSVYIYRLTLDKHLTEDILQETMLTMVSSLGKLRKPERFWAWLYRTALSNVQHYYRGRQRRRREQKEMLLKKKRSLSQLSDGYGDGLKSIVKGELAEAVVESIATLNLNYRNLLVLRCFQQLPYSEVAEVVGCSEGSAQAKFYRAKKALGKNLSRKGFGKVAVGSAMAVFGNMTSPAEAGSITVAASAMKVSTTASIVGTVTSRLAMKIAAGIVVAAAVGGVIAAKSSPVLFVRTYLPQRSEVKSYHFVEQAWDKSGSPNRNLARGRSLSKGAYEQWYFFPEGVDGPMFMMMQRWNPQQNSRLCSWMQNSEGNYYFHSGQQTIYRRNYHLPTRTLGTRRLPSDSVELTAFLDRMEPAHLRDGLDYERDKKTGLLTGAMDDRFYNAKDFHTSFSYNNLDETAFDSFRYPWPQDAEVVDMRDAMRKRGWSYFRIKGSINGRQVSGAGRIPFTYEALGEYEPWLRLKEAGGVKIIDTPEGAYVAGADGKVVVAYRQGAFSYGFTRQWIGMHTIDIIRRDAAGKSAEFSTEYFDDNDGHYGTLRIKVSVGEIYITYIVDIDNDILERIEFSDSADGGQQLGALEFTYIQEMPTVLPEEFVEPESVKIQKDIFREDKGILWLADFATGSLGR